MAKVEVAVPTDVMTAKAVESNQPARLRPAHEVADAEIILDVGPETCRRLRPLLQTAGTIIWNGPLGMFEFDSSAKPRDTSPRRSRRRRRFPSPAAEIRWRPSTSTVPARACPICLPAAALPRIPRR